MQDGAQGSVEAASGQGCKVGVHMSVRMGAGREVSGQGCLTG